MLAFSLLSSSFVTVYYQTYEQLQEQDNYLVLTIITSIAIVMLVVFLLKRFIPHLMDKAFWIILSTLVNLILCFVLFLLYTSQELSHLKHIGLLLGTCFAGALVCWAELFSVSDRKSLLAFLPFALILSVLANVLLTALGQITYEYVILFSCLVSTLTNFVILSHQYFVAPKENIPPEPKIFFLQIKAAHIFILAMGIGALREITRRLSSGDFYETPDALYLLLCLIIYLGFGIAVGCALYRSEERRVFLTYGLVPLLLASLLCLFLHAADIIPLRGMFITLGNTSFVLGFFFCLIFYAKHKGFSCVSIIALGYLGMAVGIVFGLVIGSLVQTLGVALEIQGIACLAASLLCGIGLFPTFKTFAKQEAIITLQGSKVNAVLDVANKIQDRQFDLLLKKAGLTPREREVALLCAKGYSRIRIADKLFIANSTVRNHLTAIYKCLEIVGEQNMIDLYQGYRE
jgi:DNA-binding CsgD family transcriptional regulator